MERTFHHVLCALLLLGWRGADATVYYVAPNGNDANTGTSPSTAWSTLARVEQATYGMAPGDQVLFQRGGVYRGSFSVNNSGASGAPLVFGAYGTGAAPVISGSITVNGWTNLGGGIWSAPLNTTPKYVFQSGQRMTLARTPDTGWYRCATGNATTLMSYDITDPSGTWAGGQAVIRGTMWSYDVADITAQTGNTLTYNSISHDLADLDWGFFLQGRMTALNMPGEWFYDEAQRKLFIVPLNGVDPNSQTMEVAVTERGIKAGWQKSYITIQDLAFRHQTFACVTTSSSSHVVVQNCELEQAFTGINSIGTDCRYLNNDIHEIYDTGINAFDTGTWIEDNTLSNIGMVAGSGQDIWGYMGIRSQGEDDRIVGNRLDEVGYIGISANSNAFIQHNVLTNILALLNDGGGIAFDYADGMTVDGNIVMNVIGNLESAATRHNSYASLSMGIYFGNHEVKNTLVNGNTVSDCPNVGIYVDHTLLNSGNRITNNTVYNCGHQILFSDFSNNMGAGATYPYYMPTFDDVFTGNILASLNEDQPCLQLYQVYTAAWTDYGTFDNNAYFNPYNAQSIQIIDAYSGNKPYRYALDDWRQEMNKDQGSVSTERRRSPKLVAAYTGAEQITNGTFDNNVNGWQFWPSECTLQTTAGQLDGNCMEVTYLNTNTYPLMRVEPVSTTSVTAGQWYEVQFSLRSDAPGELRIGLKGDAQGWNDPFTFDRYFPIGPTRRDVSYVFNSTISDNARPFIYQTINDPHYYIDNVGMRRVSVTDDPPAQRVILLVNDHPTSQQFPLASCYRDPFGTIYSGTVELAPYASLVLERLDPGECAPTGGGHPFTLKMMLDGPYDTNTGSMRDDLRAQGLIPITEPYSALGYAVDDPGATLQPSLLAATGGLAVVDWVLVQLRAADAAYTVVASRACLLRANGEVILPDGGALDLGMDPAGYHLCVRHRNHLGTMTATPVNGSSFDLTDGSLNMYGTDALKVRNGIRMLWAGNAINDPVLRYAGSQNDRDPILLTLGSSVPTSFVIGYHQEDVNLDGRVKYTGASNDRDIILSNIGGALPTGVRTEQLP
ncbi:MAG: right-handed parallel beta-helix repeat-containing protein [Flavobacteriales bacterium]|nr:right-handed parallel beta-helix repeat-containing protein [Flavobacteriales bacterium]